MTNKLLKMKKNRTLFKLKIEKFFKEQLWQFTLVIAFVFLFAWIFNKFIEATMFCIAHIVIRKYFDKQYHCGTTATCMFITLSIAFFGILYTLPLALSLLSTIPICYLISWVGYVVQDRIDKIVDCRNLQNEIDSLLVKVTEYENLDLYKMTETELRQYGASKHLSEVQQDILVMRVIEHLKISEICTYRNYGRTTIKYHIAEIKKKLNIRAI